MADDLMILEKAARIHHRLVSIHPFENGNGRFSRLISDRYLKACGSAYPIWPALEHEGDVRSYYIQCLKSADRGDFEPLMKLMNRFIEKK
jgi:Fic family protein